MNKLRLFKGFLYGLFIILLTSNSSDLNAQCTVNMPTLSGSGTCVNSSFYPTSTFGQVETMWLRWDQSFSTAWSTSTSMNYCPGSGEWTLCARVVGCTTVYETNHITIGTTSCDNITNGGTIGGDQNYCGATDPALISNIALPTGGTGTIEYQWQKSEDGGTTWLTNTSSNSSSYDPSGTINVNTIYRRQAKRTNCTNWISSNWVYVNVNTCNCTCPNNLITNSSFESNTTGWNSNNGAFSRTTNYAPCGSYKLNYAPNNNSNWLWTNVGNGTDNYSSTANLSFYGAISSTAYWADVRIYAYDVNWNTLGNSNYVQINKALSSAPAGLQLYTLSYTLPAGTYYMQVGFYTDNGSILYLDNICLTASTTTPTCSNVTSAGTIGSNQSGCGPSFNPSTINNITSPSGGTGTLEYMWLQSTDGNTWSQISGASGSTYNPSYISQTTYYRRCVRRVGCTTWFESNDVIITVNFCSPTYTCPTTNTLNWSQTISSTTGSHGYSAVRFICGQTTSYILPITIPTAIQSGTVNINSIQAVSYDGYVGRTGTGVQDHEQWRVLLKKSGITVYASAYTGDIQDLIEQAAWTGNLGSTVLSNGFDQVVLEHWCVANSNTGPHSVVPMSICIDYSTSGCAQTMVEYDGACNDTPDDFTPTGLSSCLSSATVLGPSAGPSYASCQNGWVCHQTDMGDMRFSVTAGSAITINELIADLWYPLGAAGQSSSCASTMNYSVTFLVNNVVVQTFNSVITGSSSATSSPGLGSVFTLASPLLLNSGDVLQVKIQGVPNSSTCNLLEVGGAKLIGCCGITCSPLTSAGTIGSNQTFCGSGNPAAFTNNTSPSGGYGSTIVYQWQSSTDNVNWTNISSATSATYDAPSISTTTYYRRQTKRTDCGTWLNSNTLTVTINSFPSANAGANKTITCSSAQSFVIGSVAISGNTYSWSPSTGLSSTTIAQPTASPTTSTNYTVTVTNSATGCTATDVVLVTVNKTTPTANAGVDQTLNCTTTSTTIGTTAVSGNTYSWSPSAGLSSTTVAQPTVSTTTTTNYTVTVTNSSTGCTATDVVLVTYNGTAPTANAGVDQTITCSSAQSFVIGTTAVSGNTYSWSPSTGLSSTIVAQPTASPTTSTNYTVTVTNSATGCTATDVVLVSVNKTAPTANAGVDQTITCSSAQSFVIGTTAVSGNTYSWSPSTGLSSTTIAQPTASPTTSTNYTVTVTNSTTGCTATDVVLVTVNKTAPTANAGVDQTLNCTTTSTTIGTTAVSGYAYSWSPSAGLSSTTVAQPTVSTTTTTNYTVTVTNSSTGCTATDVVLVTYNGTTPTANAGVDQTITCSSAQSFVIGTTAVSGNTYSWSPSIGLSSTIVAQPTASPTTSTNYTVTVTNSATGCTATDVVLVSVNKTAPTANAGVDQTITCASAQSFVIGTTAVSGNTYSWSPSTGLSSTTIAQPTASPTTSTNYTVTVTNGATGCTATDVVLVTVNKTTPTANAGVDKTLNCITTSTTIGTTAVSGNTYSWSPSTGLSSTTVAQPTVSTTTTTNYTVTVTNSSTGCTATDVVLVTYNGTAPTANAGTDKTITCSSAQSFVIGTTALSGYTYSWSPSSGLSSTIVAQPTASPTTSTNYTVTVTNSATGCTASDVVLVSVNKTAPTANAGVDQTITCSSAQSFVIGTTAVSGNTYSWSPSTGLSSTTIAQPTASPTTSTNYTVTVTNSATGCTATDVVLVTLDKTAPTANAGPDISLNCGSGSGLIGTSAISGYSYSWSPSTGLSSTTIAQPLASPTATTSYTVTVTGSNGCTATDVVLVTVTAGAVANAGGNQTIDCTTPSTVSIGTTAISGQTYFWSPSTGLSSTTSAMPTASPTSTTTYTVTATNTSSGCTATDVVTVTVNTTPPSFNAAPDASVDCLNPSVSIGVNQQGGNSKTYSWSPTTGLSTPNSATTMASPSATTIYTLTITQNSNGCESYDYVTVTVNNGAVANAGVDKTVNCTTTSTTIGTAALSGYTYSWSPSTGLSSTTIAQPTANPGTTTIYTITATNTVTGCMAQDYVTVNVDNTAPTSGISGLNTVCATETISLQATPTNTLFSYAWSATGGATIVGGTTSTANFTWPSAAANTTQTVTLVVTNTSNGCQSTYNKNITVTTEVFANAGPDKTICQGGSTAIGASPSGPAGAMYSWSPNYAINNTTVANPVVNPLTTTTYTLTTTLNGCVRSDVVTVVVNTLLGPDAEAGNAQTVCLGSSVVLGGTPTSSSPGVTYLWTPSTGLNNATIANPTFSGTSSAWYYVKVTNNSGCYNIDSVYVTVNPNCYITVSGNVFNDVNGNTNNVVDGTGINNPSNVTLYATLVNSSGTVVASVPVNANGTYTFNNVPVNSNYTVVLSTTQGVIGNPAPTPSLPSGWVNTGEDCCDNFGTDGTNNGITSVTVGTTNVTQVNFGIQQPPTPMVFVEPSQINPGGNVSVTVPSASFGGTDPNGGIITALTITTFPTNAQTITINGVTYTSSTWPVGGVTIPTNSVGDPLWPISVNPVDGAVSVVISYTVTDNAGYVSSTTGSVTLPFTVISLSGNVYNDVNGPTNVDGTGIGSPSSTQLYANLVSGGQVVAVVPVNANGTYSFPSVTPNTTYTVVLSTTQGVIGNTPPSASLPTGWTSVSEDCCDNTGNDANTNGMVTVSVGTSSTINANFGIHQPMALGNTVWNDLNQDGLNNNGESGIANATVYLYNDADANGIADGAAIQTVTTNSSGQYLFTNLDGGNYLVGVVPPSGSNYLSSGINELNPNSNIDNNDNGITTISGQTFSGTITLAPGTEPTGENPNNAAGMVDNNTNLTVDFGFYQSISLSGNVFNDVNGSANVDGTGIGSPSSIQLYANLVSGGQVVAVVPVNANGTYLFPSVLPNTTYTVVLSTTQGVIGNTPPSASLPTGWTNVSEDCCDNTGNDANTNGMVTVNVGTTSTINANFGIHQTVSLGNQVWYDVNKNGMIDGTEVGIANAVVNLYLDADANGVPDGPALNTMLTNANGYYLFTNLENGNYVVGVIPPAVSGGTYSSSTTGQESDANSNGDNNDNGINTIGNETFSSTITLVAGTEPTGENPNNTTGLVDANTNLTLDFGFFLCPSNFTFPNAEICSTETYNLTNVEPANYTGGTWYNGTVAVTNPTSVAAGTYTYVYTNGTCTANGSITIGLKIPDYSPTIQVAPSIITGRSDVRVIVTVAELLNKTSCSPVYILMPKLEPRYVFNYIPSAVSIGGVAVNNADWQLFTTNPNYYVWKYVGTSQIYPALGISKFGFIGPYDPDNTDGETTFTVTVFQGSGGETNILNNGDADNMIYFR